MDDSSLYSKEGIYGNFSYGCPFIIRGIMHAMRLHSLWNIRKAKVGKILVVGAGNGYELVYFLKKGYDTTGVEIYVPDIPIVREHTVQADAKSMPFDDKEFDVVFCAETMEHIEEKDIDPILKECRRVAKTYYFTIATKYDTGWDTHVTVKHGEWWIRRFRELGFGIIHAQIAPEMIITFDNGDIIRNTYDDGVMIYGYC